MKKEKNVMIVVSIVILATILMLTIQVVSAMPELKLPFEPGEGWDITCCYNGDGGGICEETHTGKDMFAIDFNLLGEADNGKSIRAVASGIAKAKENPGGYGYYVDIDHGDGYISRYAHLKEGTTISGQVSQGTEIGKCGKSGKTTGTHLHFVLYRKVDGQLTPVKPEPMSGYTGFKSGGGPYYSDNYEANPTITDYSLDYSLAAPGDTITFIYSINNPSSDDLSDVRLGAQINANGFQGDWIDDPANDKVVILNPRTNEYTRLYKIPSSINNGCHGVRLVILKHSTGEWFDDKTTLMTVSPRYDVNGDFVVNIIDLTMIRRAFINPAYCPYPPRCDVNNDGAVNIGDYAIARANLGPIETI